MATILESLLRSCSNKLQHIITDEAILILGVEEELIKVLQRVELIQCCIYDAKKRRRNELAVNSWLDQLRDVMYDIDEILDIARYKGTKLLLDHPSSSSSKSAKYKGLSVSSCFCNIVSRRDLAVQIKVLNKKIENISHDRIFVTFNSSSQTIGNGPTSKLIRNSNLVEPNLVGKEITHSCRKLVDLVLGHKESKSYKISIVGSGGVGKTTLAQKIYNDPKIQGSFKTHAWICVSKDYNEVNLLKEVLRNIGVHHEQGETIAELQRKIAETIEGRSFFLVLDDVWDSSVWTDIFRSPLHATTTGIILVTTRDKEISDKIGIHHTHEVDLMSLEVGWELLWKSMNIEEEKKVQNLRKIGIEIVRKCGRLPLAIKVTASALASKDITANEWKKFLGKYPGSQCMLSHEIEEVLYLSYDQLPHRLKQCFLYCALYPEDYIISRGQITKFWIAEGFIEEQQGNLLEDTADEYYYELIHRYLLHPVMAYFDQSRCIMHDLLRQLALNISKEECFIGDVETLRGESMPKLRRVTVVTKKDKIVVPSMEKVQVKARTFLTIQGTQAIDNTLFKRFRLLRVLVLNYSHVQRIPDNIGTLIHLRLLDLDYSGITCLPNSIGSLENLQVLTLRVCNHLHSLPLAITQLCNLRCLDLSGTEINQVPKGIGKLKFLNEIQGFRVGDRSGNAGIQDGWDLEELSFMSQMRYLRVAKLENVAHCITNTVLKDKMYLKVLGLSWTIRGEGLYLEDVRNSEKVFEQLIPPRNLENLAIFRFFGQRYPSWFGDAYLSSLTQLFLTDILSCADLPLVGNLPNLKFLRIDGAYAVTKVGPEFIGCKKGDYLCNDLVAFPNLEWLNFINMPNWVKWSFFEEEAVVDGLCEDGASSIRQEDLVGASELQESERCRVMPRLVGLKLENCPKLRALPRQLGKITTSLKQLYILRTENLKVVEDFPLLCEILVIKKCEGLERVSNIPHVTELVVHSCPNLSRVEGLGCLRQLGLGDDMEEIASRWVPGLQYQHRQLHGEELDVYTQFTS